MFEKPINKFCPRSGQAVQLDSLTKYRDFTVGFCNQECRNDFAQNTDQCKDDQRYFDTLIKELELQNET